MKTTCLILLCVVCGCGDDCDNPREFGDNVSGEQCWEPPEHYCRRGGSPAIGFYCRPDGSACCASRWSDCFFCGWVGLELNGECTIVDTNGERKIPQSECDGLRTKLTADFDACVKGDNATCSDDVLSSYMSDGCEMDVARKICR